MKRDRPAWPAVPRTPAQLRAREAELLEELQTQHGYLFADTLSARDRSSIMASGAGGKLKLSSAVVLKMFVPCDGALGKRVARERAKTAKTKTAKTKAAQ